MKISNEPSVASFWEHLSELRKALIKSGAIILCGIALALFFYQGIFSLITDPLKLNNQPSGLEHGKIVTEHIYNKSDSPKDFTLPPTEILSVTTSHGAKRLSDTTYRLFPEEYLLIDRIVPLHNLVILGPLDGMMASLKISFWVGLVGTSPIWLFFIFGFLAPALQPEEKRLAFPFLILSYLFLSAGFLFAFFVTIPIANHYLQLFNEGIGQNFWALSYYIDYTVSLLLANALAFELFVVLLFLVHLGVLKYEAMRAARSYMIVAAFILGALLTPPDVVTQFMLALPLIGLYELTILYAKFRERDDELLYANMH